MFTQDIESYYNLTFYPQKSRKLAFLKKKSRVLKRNGG